MLPDDTAELQPPLPEAEHGVPDDGAVVVPSDSAVSVPSDSAVSVPETPEAEAVQAAAAAEAAAVTTEVSALARLYGEPLLKLPTDLYIPPDALEIFLEAFEGPLDLLLYLIRKQNFNILDIPMAQLTLQYLKYVDQIRLSNLELAAEYLLMAAMLIEIKSRMLLPQRQVDLDAEADDPRAELVRRLLEYEQIKLAAYDLNTIPQLDRDFVRTEIFIEQSLVPTWPDVTAVDLQQAWLDVMKRAKLTQHHKISREELSVREHMTGILRRLQSSRFVEFADLFDIAGGVPVVVVNFVALLELAKETLIEITQAEPFAPIYVRLAYSPA
jgi:segregation and condensation protein A